MFLLMIMVYGEHYEVISYILPTMN